MRSGYVRVLRSPSDVDCVRDGGVLVIPVVDPGLAARLAHIIHDGSLRARPPACRGCCMQACRSSEWAIAAEALMNNAG